MSEHKRSGVEPNKGRTVAGCTARCDAELRNCIETSNTHHECETQHQTCATECARLGDVKPYSGLGMGELF